MTPPSAANVTSFSVAPTSSPVKLRTGRAAARAFAVELHDRPGVTRAHARTAPDEAAEVSGLGQRALAAGRGDLERVALAQVVQQQRHALAHRERDAVGVVDEHAQAASAGDLGEQHLDRRARCRPDASLYLSAACVINWLLTQKKRAGAHSRYCYRRLRDGTKAVVRG